MEQALYFLPLVVLIGLAVSDLIVGVSNDAVNFTNSAIGSRVAPKWVIFLIASLGILVGTVYSSNMLAIARNGVIHPELFSFSHIITIFLAVMISDVILLNIFNTYGLPTSTSVSFVFELLGSAVAMSFIILHSKGHDLTEIRGYINSDKALVMIISIFISVLMAFAFGVVVQFLTRLLLTFRVKRFNHTITAIWSAFAITFIFYYILIKGLKGSTLFSPELFTKIHDNINPITVTFFIVVLILFLILHLAFKFNSLRIVILTGTFALALAFAANDLVNFIGVPVAGFFSYQATHFDASAASQLMGELNNPTQSPFYFLIAAGLIMTFTLWFSKKARYVTKTELELARHHEGEERFGTSKVAQFIVDTVTTIFNVITSILPAGVKNWIAGRFKQKKKRASKKDRPSFDLVRASVNLMVASSLISLGTSYKLPLSTTYVTFMVAMGSSIADGAWSLKSAPYRVNGVLIVIGGWFFTGAAAFTVSFIFALIIYYGSYFAIFGLLLFALFFLMRTHKIFNERIANSKD